jgi:hypothetical protein
MADELGWDLIGVPKKYWPHVRDILSALELYRYRRSSQTRASVSASRPWGRTSW